MEELTDKLKRLELMSELIDIFGYYTLLYIYDIFINEKGLKKEFDEWYKTKGKEILKEQINIFAKMLQEIADRV